MAAEEDNSLIKGSLRWHPGWVEGWPEGASPRDALPAKSHKLLLSIYDNPPDDFLQQPLPIGGPAAVAHPTLRTHLQDSSWTTALGVVSTSCFFPTPSCPRPPFMGPSNIC